MKSILSVLLAAQIFATTGSLKYPDLPKEIQFHIEHGHKAKNIPQFIVDSALSQDWALSNIGFFNVFTPLIQPILASTKPCDPAIIVAVIDTGIDYRHPELQESIWVNPGESGKWSPPSTSKTKCQNKSCNGIDDDGNGFIDDVIGWDFVHDIPKPFDTHGHGTHISGIIASASANGMGTSGVCPKVTIMPLKYYDNSGAGYNNLTNTVRAIKYAVKVGAHIINYSGGGADPAPVEREAIAEARRKGVLFIAAAGNNGQSSDRIPYYPASYTLDNIISVTALNQTNKILSSSNYGKSVHVAAPGLSIISTLPDSKFGTMSGTSQSTAYVSGLAALLASQIEKDPRKFYKETRKWILDGAQTLTNSDKVIMKGSISIPESLKLQRKTKH